MNTYQIVRISDNQIVDSCSSIEEANKKIIFYDSPETPHKIVDPTKEQFFQ